MGAAGGVKSVGVKWEVDYSQLTTLEKILQKHITTIKKLNQVQGSVAKGSQQIVQAQKQQVQSTQQLNTTMQQGFTLLAQYAQESLNTQQQIAFLTATVADQSDAIRRATQATLKATANQRTLTQSTTQQATATSKSTKAWLRNAKTLVLWTIGAASVFRLQRMIRRAIGEAVELLFKETAEYERLTKAQNKLKASFLALLGTQDSWLKAIDNTAKAVNAIADALVTAGATARGFVAAIKEAAIVTIDNFAKLTAALKGLASGDLEAAKEAFQSIFEPGVTVETGFLDAYNKSLEESARLQEAYAEAVAEAAKEEEKLTDAQKKELRLLQDLIAAERQRIEAIEDLYTELAQRRADIELDSIRAVEDLAIEGNRRREDIEIAYQRRLEDIQAATASKRAKLEDDLRLKLLRIELRYRERLTRIEEDYAESIYEAISTRDATAALRAIRRRARDRGRAQRERDDAITLARAGYENQIREQERALERQRQDAERARARALEDLNRHLRRETEDIAIAHRRELEDLNTFHQRRRDEIELDYNRRVAEAEARYTFEENRYRAHLGAQLRNLQNYYQALVALHNTYAGALSTVPGIRRTLIGPGQYEYDEDSQAEGGVAVYTRPTKTTFAEKGPELMVAIPLAPQASSFSGSMSHNISGSVEGRMRGMEGRLTAALQQAVIEAMGRILQ